MIKYSDKIEIRPNIDDENVKRREELLERTLRILGSFNENESIIVKECKKLNDTDTVYTVTDNFDNIFSFKNCTNPKQPSSFKRSKENYQVYLNSNNNKMVCKYLFEKKLELVELVYKISNTRIIKIEKNPDHPINIKVKDGIKEYILGYYMNIEENGSTLLENLHEFVENISNLENISLESLMEILSKLDIPNYGIINIDNKPLASIYMTKGKITKYEMIDEYRKISAIIGKRINRRVEDKHGNEICRESLDINTGVIGLEVKRLMKKL